MPSSGRKNLALSSHGAVVLPSLTFIGQGTLQTFWAALWRHFVDVDRIIDGNIEECWSFPATTAQIGIRLSDYVVIDYLTITHATNTSNRASAPRELIVWGMIGGNENLAELQKAHKTYNALLSRVTQLHTGIQPSTIGRGHHLWVPLAAISYAPSAKPQQFPVFKEVSKLNIEFGILIIQVVNNWGDFFTTMCEIEVFGTPLGY